MVAPFPKMHVSVGIVFKDDKILLAKRSKRKGSLTWVFPGGKIEPGEMSSSAVVQEVLEETGVECRIVRLLGTRIHGETGVKISYWKCIAVGGEAQNMEPEKATAVLWATPKEAESLITSVITKCVRDELGLP
jgi:8-oxo-dGTP diphosphatase